MSAGFAVRPLRFMLTSVAPALWKPSRGVAPRAVSAGPHRNGICRCFSCRTALAMHAELPPPIPQSKALRIHTALRDQTIRFATTVAHAKGKRSANGTKPNQQTSEGPVELDEDESAEEFPDEEVSEEEEDDSDQDFDGPTVDTAGLAWAETGLETLQQILQRPEMQGLELYSFNTVPSSKVLRIRVDKMEDEYGSPSLEDITNIARAMYSGLEEALGEEEAGSIEVEVSSPGAERALRLPGELTRFRQLPLNVEYQLENGELDTRVLKLLEFDELNGTTNWGLADVAANKQGKKKGQGLNRKERDMRFDVPVANIKSVRVHLDV
eukprot:CAMPEP_0117673162 /NCGR_PEP_ID=MMETSP0804-20121206/14319_1 /TAXON_ID=1074897 /ORGANISM="Tetraselmis astigmatica, Strain CCMP880" /LENGTH=324 /DNA_ID=CAMNT_0005481869 /DNA_START=72 /DNA_END=1046 /DNA_ORIENTATION=+